MASLANRRRAILDSITRNENGSEDLVLRFRKYPSGNPNGERHYWLTAAQQRIPGQTVADLIVQFARVVDAWDRRPIAQPTFRVRWFHFDPNDDTRTQDSSPLPSFEAADAAVDQGPPGWRRYGILRGDLQIERGDPDGVRGAPARERFGEVTTEEWLNQSGEDL